VAIHQILTNTLGSENEKFQNKGADYPQMGFIAILAISKRCL
jgi:hypothetical protein